MTARYRDCTIFSGDLSSYIQYGAIIVMYLGTVTDEQYVINRTRPLLFVLPISIWYSAYTCNGLPPTRPQVICINASLFLVNHLKKGMLIKTAKVPIQKKYLENVIYKIIWCISKFKWNFQKDTTIAMQESAFVCKMAVILCGPQYITCVQWLCLRPNRRHVSNWIVKENTKAL